MIVFMDALGRRWMRPFRNIVLEMGFLGRLVT